MNLDFNSSFKRSENVYYDTDSQTGVVLVTMKSGSVTHDFDKDCDVIFVLDKSVFIKQVIVGNYVACEVCSGWDSVLPTIDTNIFLYAGGAWVYISNTTVYTLEIGGVRRKMWIGEEFVLADMKENTCLKTVLDSDPEAGTFMSVQIAYARCKASMLYLDDLHRDYIRDIVFTKGLTVAVKAVAGSGKTTTILDLTKKYSNKRILYLAFNKSLVTDIESKLNGRGIRNLEVRTFDSLLYKTFVDVKGYQPTLTEVKPQMMTNISPWFQGKSFKMKSFYSKNFAKFCASTTYTCIKKYCLEVLKKPQPILEQMWEKTLKGELISFETIRKFCLMEKWFQRSIDCSYDIIMIDEVQDFDMAMLRMLLDDTTLPKLFVGDPRQAIYEWRGCINAFDYMPKNALTVEFYSTFRIGEPACDQICAQFKDCWMVSKSKNRTTFGTIVEGDRYVYLFRSWRRLLEVARNMRGMWIYSFEMKIGQMRKLHEKLQYSNSDTDLDNEFEDDLPKFLRSITRDELEALIQDIEANMVAEKDSLYKFYTVHSYKGMENSIVRIADDVDGKESPNINYVALTRGMTKICVDMATVSSVFNKKGIAVSSKKKDLPIVSNLEAQKMDSFIDSVSKVSNSKVRTWTKEDDSILLDLVSKQTDYEIIIERLGRSILAIEMRLKKLAYDLYSEGADICEISERLGISVETIEECIKENEIKKEALRKGQRWDEVEINKMLRGIAMKKSFSEIAIEHQRTVGSVETKLKEMSATYYEEGLGIAIIVQKTGLGERAIIDTLIRNAVKDSKKAVAPL
jgi:hypothetical protein